MQPQVQHYILPLSPIVKPIYEQCVRYPAEWEIRPDKLVIQVINNLNIADPANVETIINLYVGKTQQRLMLAGFKPIDDASLNDICKMILQLIVCLTEMYTRFGFWQNGIAPTLKFHNFSDYDVILTTG